MIKRLLSGDGGSGRFRVGRLSARQAGPGTRQAAGSWLSGGRPTLAARDQGGLLQPRRPGDLSRAHVPAGVVGRPPRWQTASGSRAYNDEDNAVVTSSRLTFGQQPQPVAVGRTQALQCRRRRDRVREPHGTACSSRQGSLAHEAGIRLGIVGAGHDAGAGAAAVRSRPRDERLSLPRSLSGVGTQDKRRIPVDRLVVPRSYGGASSRRRGRGAKHGKVARLLLHPVLFHSLWTGNFHEARSRLNQEETNRRKHENRAHTMR